MQIFVDACAGDWCPVRGLRPTGEDPIADQMILLMRRNMQAAGFHACWLRWINHTCLLLCYRVGNGIWWDSKGADYYQLQALDFRNEPPVVMLAEYKDVSGKPPHAEADAIAGVQHWVRCLEGGGTVAEWTERNRRRQQQYIEQRQTAVAAKNSRDKNVLIWLGLTFALIVLLALLAHL
jgi:hypothetical protein